MPDYIQTFTAFGWLLKIACVFATVNLSLLLYIFKTTKTDIHRLQDKLEHFDHARYRLVHQDDCAIDMKDLLEKIEKLDRRITRVEFCVAEHHGHEYLLIDVDEEAGKYKKAAHESEETDS